MLIALALSLIVVLGVAQVFIAAKNTYVSQNAAAAMQEDARFVLSKMIQEIRMVGMFGCLGTITDASTAGDFTCQSDNADQLGQCQSQIDPGDCRCRRRWRDADLDSGFRLSEQRRRRIRTGDAPASGQLAFPIRRLIYSFSNNQLMMGVGPGTPTQLVLVDNVSAFNVSFGLASSATDVAASSYSSNPSDPARIRSVRLTLTLTTRTAGCAIKPSTWLPLCATACHEERVDEFVS